MSFQIKNKEENNLNISTILRSELHFLKYPFFNLCTNETKRASIKIEEIEKTKDGEIKTLWKVSRDIEADFPSSFARRIHKEIVEKILNKTRYPSRLIKLGSLWEVCKELNLEPSGRSYRKIKKSLEDIVKTNITTKKTFKFKKDDGKIEFFDGTFHLYDGVYFLGQCLPDGTEADAVYVLLNDMYLQNFAKNLIVPLDYDYMHSLKGNITSRLYEILIIWFYPAFTNGKKHIEKKYSTLCDYFPLTRQDSKWKAKKQLNLAHCQHVNSGFLQCDPQWKDIGKDDWLIQYEIGTKAQKWYYNIKKKTIDIKTREINKDGSNNNPLLSKLIALKIPQNRAKELIKSYNDNNTLIENWIDALDIIKPQNKAGFLVTALKERWELPEKFQKNKAAKNRENEDNLKAQYYESIFKQVDAHLAKMKQNQVKEEIEQHKKIFLKKYPTYNQLKDSIFLNPFLENDYKKVKAKELGLMDFEKWKRLNQDLV